MHIPNQLKFSQKIAKFSQVYVETAKDLNELDQYIKLIRYSNECYTGDGMVFIRPYVVLVIIFVSDAGGLLLPLNSVT